MKNLKYSVFSFILLAAFFNSCSDFDDSEQIELEDRIFENYLTTNNITVEPTESGLYYIEEEEGAGVMPQTDDWVVFNYSLYTIANSSLVSTTNRDLADNIGIYDSRVLYGPNKILVGYNIPGLDEGLSLMREGGTAKLLFKSDLGYGNNLVGAIGAYNSIMIDLELISVIYDPILDEYNNTIEFLETNEYSTDSTASGIYYIQETEGEGDSILEGDFVKIDLVASLLDGRIIYEQTDLVLQVGAFDYNSTTGLSEGLKYMKVGGVSRFVVPYHLAFGVFGKTFYDGYFKIPVPPYSSIVYDVEMKEN